MEPSGVSGGVVPEHADKFPIAEDSARGLASATLTREEELVDAWRR